MRLDWNGVAWDSSTLFDSFDRRFIMAACELGGGRAVVLPAVAREMSDFFSLRVTHHWFKALKRQDRRQMRRYPDGDKGRIAQAAGEGLKDWVRSEIDAQASGQAPAEGASALSLRTLTEAERGKALAIATGIPGFCFRGQPRLGHWGDRAIIGEAIVSDLHLLVSRKRSPVKRTKSNRWCREAHALNGDLLQEADDFVQAIAADAAPEREANDGIGPGDEFSLKAALLAAMPVRDVAASRLDGIVEGFVDGMGNSGTFVACADSALRTWKSSRSQACVDAVRPLLAGSQAKLTERRRVDAITRRAAAAGWRGRP